MKGKLFYQDPYLTRFSSKVIKQSQEESGGWYVVLRETAFYPTGGGQPFDNGLIGSISVVNVEEVDGEIRHYLDSPLPSDMQEVECVLNWERRFDHMQQHSGQHILSASFEEHFGYKTVSFHLGKDTVTIDLDIENLPAADARAAEQKANQIVKQAREIETKWIAHHEMNKYSLRKQPSVTENIRLVIIPEFDYNACGGIHPKNTAETGPIKILGWEKQRKKIRVEFICGERVLRKLDEKHRIIQQLTNLLNTPEENIQTAVVRLIDENKTLEKSVENTKESLFLYEAKELINANINDNIAQVYTNRSIQDLQKLARLIQTHAKNKSVYLIADNGDQLQVVCAKGEQAEGINMNELLKEVLPQINGKGGGSKTFAQGGGEAIISGKQLLSGILEKDFQMKNLLI